MTGMTDCPDGTGTGGRRYIAQRVLQNKSEQTTQSDSHRGSRVVARRDCTFETRRNRRPCPSECAKCPGGLDFRLSLTRDSPHTVHSPYCDIPSGIPSVQVRVIREALLRVPCPMALLTVSPMTPAGVYYAPTTHTQSPQSHRSTQIQPRGPRPVPARSPTRHAPTPAQITRSHNAHTQRGSLSARNIFDRYVCTRTQFTAVLRYI